MNNLLGRPLNYLLSSFTRLVHCLTSLIAAEGLYSVVFINGQWLKKPQTDRRLTFFTLSAVFITDTYELIFYKSFIDVTNNR